ncbi:MAG: sulfatase-like hydrolase/transferase [Verrucomicrobiales bacterium]|nr:sulfatase-like hydrolase/transferase [Verrucomicrobiales bacterium]
MITRIFESAQSKRVRSATQPCWILLLSLFSFVQAAERPNVLFIAIDDLRPELDCYESEVAISPHFDGLAAKGVRFDSAHCRLAVCNPSHVSRLTEAQQRELKHGSFASVSFINARVGLLLGELERAALAGDPKHSKLMLRLAKALREKLPVPLAVKAPGSQTRSGIVFKNESKKMVTVSWLPQDGQPREVGKINPGGKLTQSTTMGHRFRIQGPGINQVVTVTKAKETILIGKSTGKPASADAPNIVVIMGDDWSWPHASILGDKTVKTPNFDRIAHEGVLFENAFVSAPSCTPSRFAVATGQYHWRLGEGVNLGGSLADDVAVYPDLLADFGYRTGYCRKGAAPGKNEYRGTDPFGARFKDFADFFDRQENDQPFCFWYGAGEPHRAYEWQASLDSNLDLSTIEIPPYLPDNDTTRTDLGDYYVKVQKLDLFAGEILKRLEEAGELENTIVVMTGDNGMPFPRAKATLFDSGTRVPLAIRWGAKVKGGRQVSDFVHLTDLAPTFLEASGLPVPEIMTGRSLLPILTSEISGQVEKDRTHVLTGMERHVYPYPSRALRTKDFLYIRNFTPEDWPTGKAKGEPPVFDFRKTPWPTVAGAFSHNIDPGPTKQWMRLNDSPENAQAFGRKPMEELYDIGKDPHQLTNLLASNEIPEAVDTKRKALATQLANELRASGDPRFADSEHATFEVLGWTVHLNDQLVADSSRATKRMMELLHGQLQRVVDAVPEPALTHLRQIPIWINPPYAGKRGSAEYHPAPKWLIENQRNPAMARAIEITNVMNFPFENRRMPYLLLHELAHGYHHRVIKDGYANAEIRAAYERARDSGSYDDVPRFNGNETVRDKAYGMSNPMEYFAESTEAYFGKNDFFPFNREELVKHDPGMHDLIRKLWETTAP